ncbi:SURF1 family protein [Roseibium sp.]|uniref:SURF1 family protein n=1 Tax=Roseibium sp. TaxID=1936156 RepID=UPI003A9809EB
MTDRYLTPYRRLLLPTIAGAISLAILLSLGFWQLDRLSWKEALIAKVERDVSADPVPAPGPGEWADLPPFEADYRHVSVTGRFVEGDVFYYTSLGYDRKGTYSGPGYMVYSPFEADEGWTVMVNRGFVPQELWGYGAEVYAGPAKWPGEKTLTGLLRRSETPNWTTPAAQEDKRIWFARDTGHMAQVLGAQSEKLAPYSIDLDAEFSGPDGLPQAGETVVRFKNDHLGYALTWFGLAATLIGVYLTYAVATLRKTY